MYLLLFIIQFFTICMVVWTLFYHFLPFVAFALILCIKVLKTTDTLPVGKAKAKGPLPRVATFCS
jgi:hypothetical protein